MRLRSLLALVALLTLTVAPAFAAQGTCAPSSDAAFAASLAAAPEALPELSIEPQEMGWTCEEFCDWQYDDCYANRCGQFGSTSCYNACYIQFQDCMADC